MRNLKGFALRWPKRTLAERFWEKVDKVSPSNCWVWKAKKYPHGYGQFQVAVGKTAYAHRMAYELHFGPFPHHLHVLHRCDNRPCVNPDHLWLGTHQDNMRDMMTKGRRRKCT